MPRMELADRPKIPFQIIGQKVKGYKNASSPVNRGRIPPESATGDMLLHLFLC